MAERSVKIDHVILNRGGVKIAPLIATNAQTRKRPAPLLAEMEKRSV